MRRGWQGTTLLAVSAIARRAGDVLLVRQQAPGDAVATWGLPGGVVEEGELLEEALRREMREETTSAAPRSAPWPTSPRSRTRRACARSRASSR